MLDPLVEFRPVRHGRAASIVSAEEAERVAWEMITDNHSGRSTAASRLVEWIRARELAYRDLQAGVGRMLADAAERVGEAERSK